MSYLTGDIFGKKFELDYRIGGFGVAEAMILKWNDQVIEFLPTNEPMYEQIRKAINERGNK